MGVVFVSILFGGSILMLFTMVGIGCVELATVHRLGKYGENIEGQLDDVDLKSSRPGGIYGKVHFSYQMNGRTFTKKQTVDKDTALSLLARRSDLPLFSKPTKITVRLLTKKPSLARLATAPSDRMRRVNFLVALCVLGFLAALILVGMLMSTNTQPNY